MAATVSAWGKPGAWALDSEENESDLINYGKEDSSLASGKSDGAETEDFPSLSAAVTTKPKKKKGQPLSLQQFSAYGATKPAASEYKGLTPDELLMLPTGPRERSAEELDRNKLGGGFRSYGGGIRDDQPRRSFNRESNRDFASSRADETDDWGAAKKYSSSSSFDRKERGDRGGFFTDSQSRADEVDNWASNKSFVPSDPRRNDRKPGFGFEFETSNNGIDSSSWVKRNEEEGRRTGGAFDSLRERRGGGFEPNRVDSENWGRKREEVSVGSRPRLNLQPRTLPVDEGQKGETGIAAKPKGGSPFGEARPREEVLKEKGQDWKEIEEKLESVKIKDAISPGINNGSTAKRGFWNGNGGEKLQDDKPDKSWKKLESVGSRPMSAADETKTGDADDGVEGEPQI